MPKDLTEKQIKALAEAVIFAGVTTMIVDGDATESEQKMLMRVIAEWESRSNIVSDVLESMREELNRTGEYAYEFTEAKQEVAQKAFQKLSDADKYRYIWLIEQMSMNVASAAGGNLTGESISDLEVRIGAKVMFILAGGDFNFEAYRAYIDSAGA